MSTQTLDRTELDLITGEPRCTHIIKREPGDNRTAIATVMEARIMGNEVEALCGFKFVPQRDPKRLPLCSACKEISESEINFDPNEFPS